MNNRRLGLSRSKCWLMLIGVHIIIFLKLNNGAFGQPHENQQQQQQYEVTLNGVTVLNPPFIYSESGPYRGYCVDILKELSQRLKFQFTLRQSFDGQIGSVRTRDGVFGEIIEKYVDFAIGDISSNWLNDRLEAERNGIVFTRPIYLSTIKVLLTKTLYKDLLEKKKQWCKRELKKMRMKSNETRIMETSGNLPDGGHLKDKKHDQKHPLSNHGDVDVDSGSFDLQFLENHCSSLATGSSVVASNYLTIHDIFNSPDLIRVIFKGGAVHRFYSTINIDYLNDLIIVERASLSTLLARLQKQKYVLIDESKFIDYFVDHECEYTSIDVSKQSSRWLLNKMVHFDTDLPLEKLDSWSKPKSINNDDDDEHRDPADSSNKPQPAQLQIIRKEELFQNEISIAFSRSFLEEQDSNENENQKHNDNSNNYESNIGYHWMKSSWKSKIKNSQPQPTSDRQQEEKNVKRRNQRNWLLEFNQAIESMEINGILNRLRLKHWANNCNGINKRYNHHGNQEYGANFGDSIFENRIPVKLRLIITIMVIILAAI